MYLYSDSGRIEAGTYMVAAALGGNLLINVIPEHVKATTAKLLESGSGGGKG